MTVAASRFLGALTILLVLALWQIGPQVGLMDPQIIPTFGAVFRRFVSEWFESGFYKDLAATLWRVGMGLLVAAGVGIPLGLAMGRWVRIDRLLTPSIDVFRPVPATAFLPIALILLGISHGMYVLVIFIAAVIPILLAALDGARGVDPVLVDTATTLGTRKLRTARAVVLPAALPHIVTGIRNGIAQALIVAVASEMVLSSAGLGHRVLYAQRLLDMTGLYAGVVTLAIVGFALNQLFLMLEGVIVGWDRRAKTKVWN